MIKRYFVTGTDTNVGKSVVSRALLQAANSAGFRSAGYKPVASGSTTTNKGQRNTDALMLQAYSSVVLTYKEVNPYIFSESTAPNIISAAEGRKIELKQLSAGLRNLEKRANWILVEGAGGWFTPLSQKYTFADWVYQEQLPVILVVGLKLGCINHAMLTVQAIVKSALPLLGWIANDINMLGKWHKEYLETLRYMLSAPLIGQIPYLPNIEHQSLEQYLSINSMEIS